MARINVEQKALTDPRFVILGSHLQPLNQGTREAVETAYGLFQMIRVWNYCLERGLLAVPVRDLDALHDGLADAMIDAHLGEIVKGSRPRLVRIKGGEGMLDWLEKKRSAGREHGVKGAAHGFKGGRPPKDSKPGDGVSENPVRGFENNPPPAPAPAPAPAQEEKTPIPSSVPAGLWGEGAIRFDPAVGEWLGITDQQRGIWARAYPAVNIDSELARAAAWQVANPTQRKSNYARFLTNWLKGEQDKGGRSKPAAPSTNGTHRPAAKTIAEKVAEAAARMEQPR